MELSSWGRVWSRELLWFDSSTESTESTEVTAVNIDYSIDPNQQLNNTTLDDGSRNMHFYQVEQLSFLCVLLLLIVVCNSLVLRAVLPARLRGSSRMNFFVMHLAIADLSNGVVCVLPDIILKTTVSWYGGHVLCKLLKFCQEVVVFASTYVLVSLSLDRLDAIARPLQFTGSGSRSRILVSVAWGCAVLFSCPSLFLFKEVTSPVDDSVKLCYLHFPEQWHWMVYITVLAVGLFIIPTIIIIICYTSILYVIWNQGKMLQSLEHSRNGRHTWRNTLTKTASKDGDASSLPASSCSSSRGVIPKAKIKTIKMTFLIVLAFITCWSPYMIFSLLQVYDRIPATATMQAVATFFQSLAPLNSVANPIIYGVFNVCRCGNRDGACFSEVVCKWFGKTQRRASGPLRSETSGYLTTEMETKLTQREHSDKMSPGRRDSGLPYVKTAISETDRKILLRNLSSVAPEKGTNQLNIGESKI